MGRRVAEGRSRRTAAGWLADRWTWLGEKPRRVWRSSCVRSAVSLGKADGVRGLAPVRLLWDASVQVGIALDNIRDVVVGMGTADPRWLLTLAGHLRVKRSFPD